MSSTKRGVTVAEAISELLYLHDTVIVPQFGGFVKEYRSTAVDYVQGKISPPSSDIAFNENLKVDDGLLIDFYQEKNQISLEEAKIDVATFAENAKETLFKREVLTLPKIGRLLKDYENQLKFISANHNFNTAVFGLSDVSYYPILREIPQNEENLPLSPKLKTAATVKKVTEKRKSQKIAKFIIPLVLILMLVSAFFVYQKWNKQNDSLAIIENENSAEIPINVKPSNQENLNYSNQIIDEKKVAENQTIQDSSSTSSPSNTVAAFDENTIEETQNNNISTSLEDRERALEEPINNFEEHQDDALEDEDAYMYAVIYVGVFSKKEGVDSFVSLIKTNNWVPFTKKLKSGRVRVGIKIPKGTNVNALLSQVQQKIDKQAYLQR